MIEHESVRLEQSINGYVVATRQGIALPHPLEGFVDLGAALESGQPAGSATEDEHWASQPNHIVVALSPEQCASVWPCRLYKVEVPQGALWCPDYPRGSRANQVLVKNEEPCELILGPQREILMAMAQRLMSVTINQEEQMEQLFTFDDLMLEARQAVDQAAEGAGRRNTTACFGFMWEMAPRIWARQPVANAVLALAHWDLLEPAVHSEGFSLLTHAWRTVLGEAEIGPKLD